MNRLKNIKYIGYIGALIGSGGLGTQIWYNNRLELKNSDKFRVDSLLRELYTKSADFNLVTNVHIQKMFGPDITTTINNEIFERFKPDSKSFSVNNFCNYNQKFEQKHKLNL